MTKLVIPYLLRFYVIKVTKDSDANLIKREPNMDCLDEQYKLSVCHSTK